MNKIKRAKGRIYFLTVILMGTVFFSIFHQNINGSTTSEPIPFQSTIEYREKEVVFFNSMDVRRDSYNMSVFGYALQLESEYPITRDLSGSISLIYNSSKLNVKLCSTFGLYEFNAVPVEFEIHKGIQDEMLYAYTFDNPNEGFFMNLLVYHSESYISLAFDGDNKQIIYDGVSDIGHYESNMIFGSKATIYEVNTTINNLNPLKEITFSDYLEDKKESQISSVHIAKSKNPDIEPKSSDLYPIYLGYGIVHHLDSSMLLGYEDDIADKMATASSIDTAIYRSDPSEATVKSDLQYYNKEDFYYCRKIFAYHSFSHGWDEDANWYWPSTYHLDPDEVEDLWGYYGGALYYPSAMIIKSTNCYGMYTLDMSDAFIEYGADAYVGNTQTDYSLEEMDFDCDDGPSHDGFWEALIDHGDTVSTARNDIIFEWNYHNTESITWSTDNIVYEGSGSATIS